MKLIEQGLPESQNSAHKMVLFLRMATLQGPEGSFLARQCPGTSP
jgi:hypothetical protein